LKSAIIPQVSIGDGWQRGYITSRVVTVSASAKIFSVASSSPASQVGVARLST